MNDDAVAIIGMAGRFPGAPDVRALWDLLRAGREGISRFSAAELVAAGVPADVAYAPDYVRARGVLGDEGFDAGLFGIGPREAALLDPQQRLWLECTLAALEDAGFDPRREDAVVGVFAGAGLPPARRSDEDPLAEYAWTIANDKDFLATRASYRLGLTGPSLTVQTACSTSLVAVHLAVQALLAGQCDVAVAGGVSLRVPSRVGYFHREGMILAPDGHCRPFDARAQGTVPADGVGAVVLRRLADAVAAGDEIDAVILGIAVNNDGGRKVGYTAPGLTGQVEVIQQALAYAGVDARAIGFVEGHGTATPLGDPIEVAALTRVYRQAGAPTGGCLLGSLKGNLGHLNAAAGVAGLIKAALVVRHRAIPPTLHFERPNPETPLADSPFRINRALEVWPEGRRFAAVSSFGIGGTNAHAILGAAPERPAPPVTRSHFLLPLSAATPMALARASSDLAARLRDEHPPLERVGDTLATGRSVRAIRRTLVASDVDAAAAELATPIDPAAPMHEVAFLFPGQGAQYPDMGRGLAAEVPAYRAALERCAEVLRTHEDFDLPAALAGPATGERTELVQPALFAVEYALASTLIAWGITPAATLGHSLGEYVAACLAGVFSLEDALRLVAARGRCMARTAPGALLSVPLGEAATRELLDETLDLAAVNAPDQCVVAGDPAAITGFVARLRAAGIEGRPLRTARAFHGRLMDPVLDEFRRRCAEVPLARPRLPFLSCLTGEYVTAEQAIDPAYWARQIRGTVRFDRALRRLFADGRMLVEVGPGTALAALARRHPNRPVASAVVSTMRRAIDAGPDLAPLLAAVGSMWCAGRDVDFTAMRAGPRGRVHLPTYAFDRPQRDETAAPSPARLYATQWSPAAPPVAAASAPRFVLLADHDAVSDTLAARLGDDVIRVRAGTGHPRTADGQFIVDPQRREDLERVLATIEGPVHVVSTLALDAPSGLAGVEQALALGYFAAVAVVQALAARAAGSAALTLVTAGALAAGGAVTRPEAATLVGLMRVLPAEYPDLAATLVDLDPASPVTGQDALLAEIHAATRPPLVAVRGGQRLLPRHEPLPSETLPAPAIRRGAVVLITGGLGGLGITLADHLARTYGARLVLAGRRGPPPPEAWPELLERPHDDPTRREFMAWRALVDAGAECLVRPTDVSEPADVRALVRDALARFGRIDGVIHAAGVTGGGALQRRSRADALAILRPKIHGTLALDAALRDVPLDFFVLCSSLTATLGGFGQADYAAANAFQDAFAAAHDAPGRRVVAIAWDGWRDVGAAARHARGTSEHPLLAACTRTPTGAVGETVLEPPPWPLAEHRVGGRPVLPGTAYAELVVAVAQAAGARLPLHVRELSLVAPLIGGAARRLRSEVRREGDELVVRCTSDDDRGSPRVHALASVAAAAPPRPPALDLARLLARGERHTSLPPRVRPGGITGGPRWSCLLWWQDTPDGTLGRFELPAAHRDEAAQFWLHPALFDAASGVIREPGDALLLPFAYDALTLYERLPPTIYALGTWAPRPGGLTARLRVAADDGRVVAELGGYVLRQAQTPEGIE